MEKFMRKRNAILLLKAAAIVLCLTLLLTVFAFLQADATSASATVDPTRTITVSDAQVRRGEEFTVDISLNGNEGGMFALRLEVKFDRKMITLVDAYRPAANTAAMNAGGWAMPTAGCTMSNGNNGYAMYGSDANPFVIFLVANSQSKGSGLVARLTFKASSDIVLENDDDFNAVDFSVTCDASNTRVELNQDCEVPVTDGRVEIAYNTYILKLKYKVSGLNGTEVATTVVYDSPDEEGRITLQKATENVTPYKASTPEYTYAPRGWALNAAECTETHLVYEPTFEPIPVPYTITFRKGVEQTNGDIEYVDTEAFTDGYGTVIPFDDYTPTAAYDAYHASFAGWYMDENCETPVNFATIPVGNRTIYGYYVLNEDRDPTARTKLATEVYAAKDGANYYVYANVNVEENFVFNSVRFALDYDDGKLALDAFKYETDSPFYGVLTAVFPAVNAAIDEGTADVTAWQSPEAGYEPELVFAFLSASTNVTSEGKLLTLRFRVLDEETTDWSTAIGVKKTSAENEASYDVTRLKGNGSAWYVDWTEGSASLEVLRVRKPSETTQEYTYNHGNDVTYVYAQSDDAAYYAVSGNVEQTAGTHAVTASLITDSSEDADARYITWKDGTTAAVEYPFVIKPFAVTIPEQHDDYATRYVYPAAPSDYTFKTTDATSIYYETSVSSTESVLDADTYTVTAHLVNGNYCWTDQTTDDIEFDFIVNKKPVISPVIVGKKYNGLLQTADIEDGERYVVTANAGGTNYGTYPVVLTLKDSDNYCWKDAPNSAAITLDFKIVKAQNYWKISPHVVSKYYDGYPIETSQATAAITPELAVTSITFYNENGNEISAPTVAGVYSVVFTVPDLHDEETDEIYLEGITETWAFEIKKVQLAKPVAEERIYVYDGKPKDFKFVTSSSNTDRYVVNGTPQTEVGVYAVTVNIPEAYAVNYCWRGDEGENQEGVLTYTFEIRRAALSASGEGYAVTVTEDKGFVRAESFSVARQANVELPVLYDILGQSEGAAKDKCILAPLTFTLSNRPFSLVESFRYEIELPEADRTGYIIAYFDADEVVLYEATLAGNVLSFTAPHAGNFLLLADHLYVETEQPSAAQLKTPADCVTPAEYYKICSCGKISETETFFYGEPNGHSYDVSTIEWNWASDYSSCFVRMTCGVEDCGHVETFRNVTVAMTDYSSPRKAQDGYIIYTATFVYNHVTYTDEKLRVIPSDGHEYSTAPTWSEWMEAGSTYEIGATFVCDCGTSVVQMLADVSYTLSADRTKITYKATVFFNSREYFTEKEIDAPKVFFSNKGETFASEVLIPGDTITFIDPPAREDGEFIGWLSTGGILIVKDENGVAPEYKIGLHDVTFVAKWADYSTVNVSVKDAAGASVTGAIVRIFDGDLLVATAAESAAGYTLHKVPFGNYKLVVSYASEGNVITKSDGLDVSVSQMNVSVTLPANRFNTILEGEGSAEGLENAISEEERKAIKEGTEENTVNEITITQTRTQNVSESIQTEMQRAVHAVTGNAVDLVEFYDISMVMIKTIRNAQGESWTKRVDIYEADGYQTNIFPISTLLLSKIAAVGGTVDNVFVYKRHTNSLGSTTITRVPKVSAKEGAEADYECFFIKKVVGEDGTSIEYIAIRQKEYSEFGFGVSTSSVLLANEITELSISDWTFASDAKAPFVRAKYGAPNVVYTYSTSENGEYVAEVPTNAGLYFLKAYIPATSTYESATKVTSFRIAKKAVAKPEADATRYVYSGAEQTYIVAASEEYTVTGNVKTAAGRYVVTVALKDAENCLWEDGTTAPVSFDFVIERKKITDVDGLAFKDKSFSFNFKEHSIYIEGELPEGVRVEYDGNGERDFGRYYVKATFISDNENYEVSEPLVAVMTIRLNWVVIIILLCIVLLIFAAILVIVEKTIREKKAEENKQKDASAKEGGSNE